MNHNHPNIANDLMSLDPSSPAARAQYERTLRSLFDRKPTRADYARLLLMGIGGLAGAAVCGLLALTEPAGLPTRTRVVLALLAAIGLTWASLAALVFRRGSVNSATHGTTTATLGFAFSLLSTAALGILSLSGANRNAAPGLVLLPAVPLALSAVVLVVHHLRQAELRLRRDLLEAEYRLSRPSRPDATTDTPHPRPQ